MKKAILLAVVFLISFSGLSQSIWKKLADVRKDNKIKETSVYLVNLENPEEKRLWDWNSYDRAGKLVESKRYLPNGNIKTHYKFEHPSAKTRVLISLDKRGKEIERIEQVYDLSGEKEPLKEFSDNGFFRYEYDENGNTTKVWRIKEKPELLQTEVVFDENDLRILVKSLVFGQNGSTYISTSKYERDSEGNIMKVTIEAKGKTTNIEIHEHIKYGS